MNRQPSPSLIIGAFGTVITIVMIIAMLSTFSIRVERTTVSAQGNSQSNIQAVAQVSPQSANIQYTLRTTLGGDPAMSFVGVGGAIDGVTDPLLTANVGDTVTIRIINGSPVEHDFVIDALNVRSEHLAKQDQVVEVSFKATQPGEFVYGCSLPGHRITGMEGKFQVKGEAVANAASSTGSDGMGNMNAPVPATPKPMVASAEGVWAIRNPTDMPQPVGKRAPTTIKATFNAEEITAQLADGTSYTFFTFDKKIPGPMLRGRVGDTFEITVNNLKSSAMVHSIDLHAVTGPGGGAVYTQTKPGESTTFSFQALNPGVYVYHCATPSVAEHMANGMYGLIVIEPDGGLPPVDREFYVMQGELYTTFPFGTKGHQEFSYQNMLDEKPQYFIFNGAAGALTKDEYALRAKVGETVRIYFGVGGPNFTSSFHVIGEIFDRVYEAGSITSEPLTNVQTTSVAPGSATMVEFKVNIPGRYILVDHALSRLEKGLAGYLYVEGPDNPDVFYGTNPSMAGH